MKQSVFASWPEFVEPQAMPWMVGVPLTHSWGWAGLEARTPPLRTTSDRRNASFATPTTGIRERLLAVFGAGRGVCPAAGLAPNAAPQSRSPIKSFVFIQSPSRKRSDDRFLLRFDCPHRIEAAPDVRAEFYPGLPERGRLGKGSANFAGCRGRVGSARSRSSRSRDPIRVGAP